MNEETDSFQNKIFDKVEQLMAKNHPTINLKSLILKFQDIDGYSAFFAEVFNAIYETGYEDGFLGKGPYGTKGLTINDLNI